MLEQNLIKIYEQSFRDNREMAAITDYFKGETFSYYEMAKEIAKLHLMFKEAGVENAASIAGICSPSISSQKLSPKNRSLLSEWLIMLITSLGLKSWRIGTMIAP